MLNRNGMIPSLSSGWSNLAIQRPQCYLLLQALGRAKDRLPWMCPEVSSSCTSSVCLIREPSRSSSLKTMASSAKLCSFSKIHCPVKFANMRSRRFPVRSKTLTSRSCCAGSAVIRANAADSLPASSPNWTLPECFSITRRPQ